MGVKIDFLLKGVLFTIMRSIKLAVMISLKQFIKILSELDATKTPLCNTFSHNFPITASLKRVISDCSVALNLI